MILSVLIFSGNFTTGIAQIYHYPFARMFPAPGPEKYYRDNLERPDDDDGPGISYTVLVSSGFWGNGYSWSVAPEVSLKVSPRLRIQGGVVYTSQMGHNGFIPFGPVSRSSIPGYSSAYLYASGTYALKPGLFLSGSVRKNLWRNRPPGGFSSFGYTPGDSYSLRMDYFISRSLRIGAEIRYSNDFYQDYPMPVYFSPGWPGY